MHQRKHISFWFFLVLTLVPAFWILCDYLDWLIPFKYETLNWRYDLRGEISVPINLLYVDVDSETMDILGERPIPRTFFANAIDGLFKYGHAKIIGTDLIFSESPYSSLINIEEVTKDTQNLKKILDQYPRLVMAAKVIDNESKLEGPEKKLFGENELHIGLINVEEKFSHSSATDWLPIFETVSGQTYYTLALEMVRLFYDIPKENIEFIDKQAILHNNDGSILYKIPLRKNKFVEVNWFSKWISPDNKHFSFKDAINANTWIHSDNLELKSKAEEFYKAFNNSIVLIGEVDSTFNNLAPTPFDEEPVPKIGIHGNLIKTIISKKFLKQVSFELNTVIIIILTILVALPIIFISRKNNITRFISIVILPLYLIATIYLFNKFDWILPIISPIGSALSTAFLILLIQLINIEKERNRVKQMFGAYISPDLVNEMIEEGIDPQLGGQEKIITALFNDIENFSKIAELLNPSELIELINEYLFAMTKIIQEEKGTLDKYVGDAIISMFGAPVSIENHALAACRTACRMQLQQLKLCEEWRSSDKKWPEIVLNMRTRVGISTGMAIVGNMGSKIRFNYTMLGNNVNLASRCQYIAKTYGAYCVVTDSTRQLAENNSDIVFRFLDKILFDEKSKSIEIHEILGFKEDLSERTFECLRIYAQGITDYFSANWDSAIANFEKSAALEPNLNASINPSKLFLARCKELKSNNIQAPWDGIFKLHLKNP